MWFVDHKLDFFAEKENMSYILLSLYLSNRCVCSVFPVADHWSRWVHSSDCFLLFRKIFNLQRIKIWWWLLYSRSWPIMLILDSISPSKPAWFQHLWLRLSHQAVLAIPLVGSDKSTSKLMYCNLLMLPTSNKVQKKPNTYWIHIDSFLVCYWHKPIYH